MGGPEGIHVLCRPFGRFLVEIGLVRLVTNMTRSNRDKSLINFLDINVHIKDKTGVLTCGEFKSVNNHSERRAKAEVVISYKSIALLSGYKSLGAFIVFHCYFPFLSGKLLQLMIFSSKTVQFNTQQHPKTAPAWFKPCQTTWSFLSQTRKL